MAAFQSSLCALLLLHSVIKVSGQDGKLIVPAVWKYGARIELICELYSTGCPGGTISQVVFKKDGAIFCPLDNTKWNGNCLTGTPDNPPDRCWCKTGTNGAIDYVYWFWADLYVSNGTWTCEISCTPAGGGFSSPLNINVTEGVGKTVSGNPEEGLSCSKKAKCVFGSDRSTSECRCPPNKKGLQCDDCSIFDFSYAECDCRGGVAVICVIIVVGVNGSITIYIAIHGRRRYHFKLIFCRGEITEEPDPDYLNGPLSNSTGHTATGSKKNGQGVTPL